MRLTGYLLCAVAAVGLAATVGASSRSRGQQSTEAVLASWDARKAEARLLPVDAGKVTVVWFADWQCRFCNTVADLMDRLSAKYNAAGGTPRFQSLRRGFPLDSECNPSVKVRFHRAACVAENAYRLATERGAGADLKRWFVEHVTDLTPESVVAHVERSMSVRDLAQALEGYKSAVEQDVRLGNDLGVKGLPTVYVNAVLAANERGSLLPLDAIEAVVAREMSKLVQSGNDRQQRE